MNDSIGCLCKIEPLNGSKLFRCNPNLVHKIKLFWLKTSISLALPMLYIKRYKLRYTKILYDPNVQSTARHNDEYKSKVRPQKTLDETSPQNCIGQNAYFNQHRNIAHATPNTRKNLSMVILSLFRRPNNVLYYVLCFTTVLFVGFKPFYLLVFAERPSTHDTTQYTTQYTTHSASRAGEFRC